MKRLNLVIIIAISIITVISLISAFYFYKGLKTANARIDTIVKYIQVKPSVNNDSLAITYQTKIDSLKRVLEFNSVKEDYYIQQLNMQSTWIVMFVSTLFVIFTIFEYGIFLEKVATIQQSQIKYNEENDKRIHNFDLRFNEWENKLVKLQSNIQNTMGNLYAMSAVHYEATGQYILSAIFRLNAIEQYIIAQKSNIDKETESFIGINLSESLKVLPEQITKHEITKSDYDDVMRLLNYLRKTIDNNEHQTALQLIRDKIIEMVEIV